MNNDIKEELKSSISSNSIDTDPINIAKYFLYIYTQLENLKIGISVKAQCALDDILTVGKYQLLELQNLLESHKNAAVSCSEYNKHNYYLKICALLREIGFNKIQQILEFKSTNTPSNQFDEDFLST